MHIKVNVKDKQFEISCGNGVQDLAWLALTGTYLYGKDSYPRGNFMPTHLMTVTGEVYHPRSRIQGTLEDGSEVLVKLRDLSEPQDPAHVDWYEKAYGAKRNISECIFRYHPKGVDFSTTYSSAKVIVRFTFTMFEEVKNEFDEREFPSNFSLELAPLDSSRRDFEQRISLPFGKIERLRICELRSQNNEGEPRELADQHLYANYLQIPLPWSKKQMKEAMRKEEEEQKRREDEAIKKSYELSHQENQAAVPVKTIYDVWPEAPAQLSPHFPLLYDVFSLYANFHYPDEDLITAHDFLHFLRTFDLIQDMEDLFDQVVRLGEELEPALENVLEPAISLYHFLYLLVKFSELKHPDDPQYSFVLEKIAKSKTLWLQDKIKAEMLKPEVFEKFINYEPELREKFQAWVSPEKGHRLELKKPAFISLIQETHDIPEAALSQLWEDTLYFSPTKYDQMLYPDFLETLLRLAAATPLASEKASQYTETEKLALSLELLISNKLYQQIEG